MGSPTFAQRHVHTAQGSRDVLGGRRVARLGGAVVADDGRGRLLDRLQCRHQPAGPGQLEPVDGLVLPAGLYSVEEGAQRRRSPAEIATEPVEDGPRLLQPGTEMALEVLQREHVDSRRAVNHLQVPASPYLMSDSASHTP